MANEKHSFFQLLFFTLFCTTILVRGSRVVQMAETTFKFKDISKRLLIGSVVPICTYNECKGCKHKCTAMQVPVQGNDPVNSPYRYKCVCSR
ncbi:EPIDERMAL PATTERNING FACTOR-like protein 9 [Sesamum indicum]|uniref:EPIDERMAL PATTERNING FACTOR-like protein 9 n=1 Tax=Sesamum indicum TaxID=4182 RepID=A0A8M8V1R7_SESIN|nr:EPIDERMAL PATTERNING FACTOR-like protein 9 [Sesamum indicum]